MSAALTVHTLAVRTVSEWALLATVGVTSTLPTSTAPWLIMQLQHFEGPAGS